MTRQFGSDARPIGQGSDSARDREILIRSRYPVVAVDTLEEDRLFELLGRVARRLDVPLCTWSRTQGLVARRGRDPERFDLDGLAAEIESAVPLSVTLAERVETLRLWARGRAVPAT